MQDAYLRAAEVQMILGWLQGINFIKPSTLNKSSSQKLKLLLQACLRQVKEEQKQRNDVFDFLLKVFERNKCVVKSAKKYSKIERQYNFIESIKLMEQRMVDFEKYYSEKKQAILNCFEIISQDINQETLAFILQSLKQNKMIEKKDKVILNKLLKTLTKIINPSRKKEEKPLVNEKRGNITQKEDLSQKQKEYRIQIKRLTDQLQVANKQLKEYDLLASQDINQKVKLQQENQKLKNKNSDLEKLKRKLQEEFKQIGKKSSNKTQERTFFEEKKLNQMKQNVRNPDNRTMQEDKTTSILLENTQLLSQNKKIKEELDFLKQELVQMKMKYPENENEGNEQSMITVLKNNEEKLKLTLQVSQKNNLLLKEQLSYMQKEFPLLKERAQQVEQLKESEAEMKMTIDNLQKLNDHLKQQNEELRHEPKKEDRRNRILE